MIIIDKLHNTSSIKNIFFDIEGTITRWINVKDFLKKSLEELNMPYKDEYLKQLFKAMKMNEYHVLTTGCMEEDVYAKLLGTYISDLKEYGLTGADLKNKMFDLEASETFIDNDVIEELTRLKEEYNLYCYTNWFITQALKKLDYYDLRRFFLSVHSPEDLFLKQSTIAFKYMLEKYQLKGEETLFVGDSKTDIIPSKKAGIKTVYINYGIKSNDDFTKESMDLIHAADASITKFSDLHVVLTKKIY